jgi:UDP-2-acetamido-2,6-beta-L-arabino-hexul-4-ose reductase
MIRVGITGQDGFIGSHLSNTLKLFSQEYSVIPFERSFFSDTSELERFVSSCDVIVHLAALNRHEDRQVIYDTNMTLTTALVRALERNSGQKKVIFSSSTQEDLNSEYGRSKKEAAKILHAWAAAHKGISVSLTIPNVFGPFGKPFYNSVVATFCHQLTQQATPEVKSDSLINLIYIGELVQKIKSVIDSLQIESGKRQITATSQINVSDLLNLLTTFKVEYLEQGIIPQLDTPFKVNLFNTFRSYITLEQHFPFKLKKNSDARGTFVEIVKLNVGGQVSFSTTVPGITRGNHFHTRKIERFCVLKGQASIEMRKFGTKQIYKFEVNGNEPSFIDMPVWFTHNIKNQGDEELLTIFWINEFFDASDPDTYFETV